MLPYEVRLTTAQAGYLCGWVDTGDHAAPVRLVQVEERLSISQGDAWVVIDAEGKEV